MRRLGSTLRGTGWVIGLVTMTGCLQIYGNRAPLAHPTAAPLVATPSPSPSAAPVQRLVVEARYPLAANWNDWIKADLSAACVGNETGLGACVHGGEARRVVTPYASCAGLGLADALGVFDWTCGVAGGSATFTSSLRSGKGLANLVQVSGGAASWIDNAVTLTGGADGAIQSSADAWWANPLAELTPTQALDTAGTIYVADATTPTLGAVTADHVAVVAQSGAQVQGGLYGSGRKFLWFEGSISGGSVSGFSTIGLFFDSVRFAVARNLTVQNVAGDDSYYLHLKTVTTGEGIRMDATSGCRFENISVSSITGSSDTHTGSSSGHPGFGIHLVGSTYNDFRTVLIDGIQAGGGNSITGAAAYGLSIEASADQNRFQNVVVSDVFSSASFFADAVAYGILVDTSASNQLSGLTVFQVDRDANGSDTGGNGVGLGLQSASGNSITGLVAGIVGTGMQGTPGKAVSAIGSTGNGFHGTLNVFSADQLCSVDTGNSLYDLTCTLSGADHSGGSAAAYPVSSISDATLVTDAPF